MKKLLGLLALTASVSNLALAESGEQDTLKNIYFSTEFRHTATDKSREKSNELGLAGFRKANTVAVKWRNIVGGDLNLSDEGNLGLRFEFQNDQDRARNPYDAYKADNRIGSYGAYDKSRTWENDIALYKDVTLGSWTSKWELGWKYKATNGKSKYAGHRGTSNEIYVGPTFDINFLGQNFNAKTQLVYFDETGNKSADNAWSGNDFDRKKVSGIGANIELSTSGKIFDNKFGNLGYYANANQRVRDARGTLTSTQKDAKPSVYLDYAVGATYNTPSVVGFYGLVNTENEWEKHTAKHGFQNNFSVWTGLGYKVGFDLPVGTLTVNPVVKYKVVNKETVKGSFYDKRFHMSPDKEKYTRETNEVRAGVSVGLEVK